MMKKTACLLLCMCICLSLAACSSNQEEKTDVSSVVSQEPRSTESSQASSAVPEESTQEPESASQQEPITEAVKYAQVDTQTDEASAVAYLTLKPDNTFVLAIEFYDGMPEITGSYQLENGTYVMSQLETSTEAIQLSGIQTMKFVQSGENLIYEGDAVEQTVPGAEFRPVEQ